MMCELNKSVNGPLCKLLTSTLSQSLQPISITVTNNSWKHTHHQPMRQIKAGEITQMSVNESHLSFNIVSNEFVGLNHLKRHRLVLKLLDDKIKPIHSIQFQLKTLEESQRPTQ